MRCLKTWLHGLDTSETHVINYKLQVTRFNDVADLLQYVGFIGLLFTINAMKDGVTMINWFYFHFLCDACELLC